MEDPSDDFSALRDFVDCRNALKLNSFRPPNVHRPYAESARSECRKKLKLQKVNLFSVGCLCDVALNFNMILTSLCNITLHDVTLA